MKRIKKFFKSDLGATAIEYGLIAALISVVIIAALQLTGNSLKSRVQQRCGHAEQRRQLNGVRRGASRRQHEQRGGPPCGGPPFSVP